MVASCNHKEMLRSDYAGQNCSVARALEAIGERWTLLVIRELLRGRRRFGALQQELGIAKNVLAARLDKLVDLGIADRFPSTARSDWNEYGLTEKGSELFYVVDALMAWGDKYDAPLGPPAVIQHRCGSPAGHRVVCAACGEDVTPRNVRLVAGPAAPAR